MNMREEGALPRERKCVLVADDAAAVRRSIGMILNGAGYDVVEAENGEQVVESLRPVRDRRLVDAVLCDLRLTHAAGGTAIAHVRHTCPDTPVIVLAAYPDIEPAVSLMRQGVVDFLIKPVLQDELLTVVERAVSSCGERQGEG